MRPFFAKLQYMPCAVTTPSPQVDRIASSADIIRLMPLPLAVLFRVMLLLVMIGYAALMYVLVRDITGNQPESLSVIGLSALGTLVLMLPLVWIVGLPELPEIYMTWWRATRRWRRGRCPVCDYPRMESQSICSECGRALIEPQPYRFTGRTVAVFTVMIALAWLLGCVAGELWWHASARNKILIANPAQPRMILPLPLKSP